MERDKPQHHLETQVASSGTASLTRRRFLSGLTAATGGAVPLTIVHSSALAAAHPGDTSVSATPAPVSKEDHWLAILDQQYPNSVLKGPERDAVRGELADQARLSGVLSAVALTNADGPGLWTVTLPHDPRTR
jgi:hypothetical protein